jgi:hypothetical protein
MAAPVDICFANSTDAYVFCQSGMKLQLSTDQNFVPCFKLAVATNHFGSCSGWTVFVANYAAEQFL